MADIGIVDESITSLRTIISDLERERIKDKSPDVAATATAIDHIQRAIQSLEVVLDAELADI